MGKKHKITFNSNEEEDVASFLLQTTRGLNHLHISGAISPKEDDILDYIRNFGKDNEDFLKDYEYFVRDVNLLMIDGSVLSLFQEMFFDMYEGKIKNINDVLDLLNSKSFLTLYQNKIIVVILRNAESFAEFSTSFLKSFFEIPTSIEILVKFITVSKLSWHVISTRLGIKPLAMEIALTPLSRSEMALCLVSSIRKNKSYKERFEREEFENIIDVFLNVTYKYCADYNILLLLLEKSFGNLIKSDIETSGNRKKFLQDISNLFHRILSHHYMGIRNNSDVLETINLPIIAKYVIVAAYCASFNPPSSDKRFFVKKHVKQRKTMRDVKKDPKNSFHELGPKSFSIDRFRMIFSYLLSKQDEIDPLNVGTIDVLENLCNNGMLERGTKQTNFEFPKYRSVLTKEFVEKVGESIDITLNDYLHDFASL